MRILAFIVLCAIPGFADASWARFDSPGSKLNFEAYSIQAPFEQGWMVNRGGPYDVGFGATLSRTHTWTLTAATIPLDARFDNAEALLVHVKAQFVKTSDPVRFRILESKGWVQELRGAVCAKTYFKAEDRLAKGSEAAVYVIEATAVTCVHPDAPELAVELGYHERYRPGEKVEAQEGGGLMPRGERFIRSVKFWRPVPGSMASAGR